MSEQTQNTRDFAEFITDLRGGICHQDISVAMQRAADAAMKTGKMATVSLQLKIKPQGERQVTVDDIIKTTLPEPTKPPTVMFVDDDRNLSRSDSRQMELKDIGRPKAELVELNHKTGELREASAK